MIQRTISIKLLPEREDTKAVAELQSAYREACTQISSIAQQNRCWNRVALHNLSYSSIRKNLPLGSQMVCNAIFSVCKAYKARKLKKSEIVPLVEFRKSCSVHFDKRTYTLKGDILSLYTLKGRIEVKMKMGEFQRKLFETGLPKEAELICKKGRWYFNLVLDLPDIPALEGVRYFGVDLGENNVAAMSSGKVISGGEIRHERDKFLDRRRKLQSNGSQSAMQLLKKISGKEARLMRQINHELSKKIVEEALRVNATVVVLEDLTNIRKRVKAGKRMRTRLHRWAFAQLQAFIQYKAEARGLRVMYVNPAYSTILCLECGGLGTRNKHQFKCLCGNQQHSDIYAAEKLCRFAESADSVTCTVDCTQVAI